MTSLQQSQPSSIHLDLIPAYLYKKPKSVVIDITITSQPKLNIQPTDEGQLPSSPSHTAITKEASISPIFSSPDNNNKIKNTLDISKTNIIDNPDDNSTAGDTTKVSMCSKKLSTLLKKSSPEQTVQAEFSKRRDKNGVSIIRGGKAHSISFQTKIHTVVLVECWKEYNKPDVPFCTCSIF